MIDVLLVNGVTLPYHVLDKGVERNQQEGSAIRVVFIYRNNKKNYQSSLDAVLTRPAFTERSAEQNLEVLIRSNINYVLSYFKRKNIDIDTKIIPNPSSREIIDMMDDVQFIYLDQKTFTHPQDFAFVGFPYEELNSELSYKLQICMPKEPIGLKKKRTS